MPKPMKATLSEIKHITQIERQRCVRIVRREMKGAEILAGRYVTYALVAKVLREVMVLLEHPELEDQ